MEESLAGCTHTSPIAPRAGLPDVTSKDIWRDAPPQALRPHSAALSSEMYLDQLLAWATGEKKGCVCACVSYTVPCNHTALCRYSKMDQVPLAQMGQSPGT